MAEKKPKHKIVQRYLITDGKYKGQFLDYGDISHSEHLYDDVPGEVL